MSDLQLPKEYLSFSSVTLWQRDPGTFRRRYYEGDDYLVTPYTEFGNKVGQALETGEYFDSTLEKVPVYSNPEQKIEVVIAGVPFLMYLDSFDPDTKSILEYKTGILSPMGKDPWDRVKVRKHTQLPIYTLGVRLKYGDWNPNIKLVWMETRWGESKGGVSQGLLDHRPTSKQLELTGRVEIFDRVIQDWELQRMEKLIRESAEAISNDYKLWKKTGTI